MNRLSLPLLACLTLGLAPFFPEPHIIGKLRWLLGGGHGMAAIDVFDLALHGAPWVWLAIAIARLDDGTRTRWRRTLLLLAFTGATFCVLWSLRPG